MALLACPACDGLVPPGRATCLHCDAPLPTGPRRRAWVRRLLAAATGGVATITLMACYGGPMISDDCVDGDHDGWFPACYDLPCDPHEDPYCDCNDLRADIHPGAPDPLGDGLDQDCSGEDGPGKDCLGEGCLVDAHPPPPDATSLPDAAMLIDAPSP